MSLSHHSYSANTGLLDARGTGQVLHTLSSGFRAVEFADFCTIAEEIVLRDQILLVGKYDMIPQHLRLVLEPIVSAKIFVPVSAPFTIPKLDSEPRQLLATSEAIRSGLTSASLDDATFEASRMLGGEAFYGVAATPLLRQLQHLASCVGQSSRMVSGILPPVIAN